VTASDLCQRTWTSPIGPLLLVANAQALRGLWFADQAGIAPSHQAAPVDAQHPVLVQAVQQLQAYFAGQRQRFDLPLAPEGGTPFQQAVWQALAAIPYGATTSYRALAERIGRPKAVRAVGGAVGRNPLGIVLPCHRVLGAQGQLTGYTGGLVRKQALLRLEHIP
jgi:methylated-DNA-[protein]-cysteine S-methyltransferase